MTTHTTDSSPRAGSPGGTSPLPAHVRRVNELDDAWRAPSAGERLDLVRKGAHRLRERLLESGRVEGVRTFDMAVLPYPASFALGGAARSPMPYIAMTNRMNIVQFRTDDGATKTLLFNPTDAARSAQTPFFVAMQKPLGTFVASRLRQQLERPTAAEHLASVGLSPADVDYLAFDHLHTQDLRGMLGTDTTPAVFPRAKLLVWKPELDIFRSLHPFQEPWFVRDAIRGVPRDRFVVVDDGDHLLGKGVMLVRTPGHTVGNWSLALSTDSGVWVVSENGVCCDNYAPQASRIPGVAAHAKRWGAEVVLNANTIEGRNDQYISMVLEKALADRVADAPEFYQHFPSSEMTKSVLGLGYVPTWTHRGITSGALRKPG